MGLLVEGSRVDDIAVSSVKMLADDKGNEHVSVACQQSEFPGSSFDCYQ
jgi:hypothetical protein